MSLVQHVKPYAHFLLLALLFVHLPACKEKQVADVDALPPETLAQFLTGYTSGMIGKKQPILVQFSRPIVEESSIGAVVNSSWFELSPSAALTAKWRNQSTLELRPETQWVEGETYLLRLRLAKFFPDEEVTKDFSTRVEVKSTRIDVVFDGLFTPDATKPAEQELRGYIQSNEDMSALNELEKLLRASQDGKGLSVAVNIDPNYSTRANFRITGIKRLASASEVAVDWDASRIEGAGQVFGSRSFPVSSIDDFAVVEVKANVRGKDYVEVVFTDPVSRDQDMKGLIRIEGVSMLSFSKEGNRIKAYPSGDLVGEKVVLIDGSIENSSGISLGKPSRHELFFGHPNPQVRLVGEGSIMPHIGQRLFPFEAIGLKAVRVEIFKIFGNNVQQFLTSQQRNGYDYEEDYYYYDYGFDLNRVGRIVHQERVMLQSLGETDYELDKWSRFALDLDKFIQADDRAIYEVRIGFSLEDATKDCEQTAADFGYVSEPGTGQRASEFVGFDQGPVSIMDSYYSIYGSDQYEGFDWDHRNDPCKPLYYNKERFISREVLISNLGLIAKQNNDRQTVVIVTDLLSGGPVKGAQLTLFDAQRQKIISGSSDVDGRWLVETEIQPTFVMARQDDEVAYLEINQKNALNTSRFPTSGQNVAAGVKGTFYAERGVWRPGDSIYLNFVLENSLLKLPPNYPINFTLTDPRGNIQDKRVVTPTSGKIYALHLATQDDDPTGNWRAEVKVGGKLYAKYLKVETIKPNRLKVNLTKAKEGPLTAENGNLNIQANWLHGAPAANLRTLVLGQLQPAKDLYAEQWKDYVFHDPARKLENQEEQVLFDGPLDGSGATRFAMPDLGTTLPGPMQMAFNTRVFESGGDFSADNVRFDLVNFESLAGLILPRGHWGGKRLKVNEENEVEVIAISPDGKAAPNQKLEVGLYRVDWHYWWQSADDRVARFNSGTHEEALETYQVTTRSDGRAIVKITPGKWGRYLLRVCNPQSGHCAGDYFYTGSPSYLETDKDAAAMLPLRMEDKTYEIGETATVSVESEQGGMLLLSLENGSGVIETRWVEAQKGTTNIPIRLDETMLPNVYATVMLIQPHANTKGGRPIRQYGVMPIQVEDPKTRLQPQIATAAEYEPEAPFSVTVSEENGQEMHYTLAVVDEGLLGLTRFQTPDLWSSFFGKEALSVKTFDLYNRVISSMDGQFNRILAIGGDGEGDADTDKAKANRFEPVVMHLGPFRLGTGQKVTHDFKMPNYIGAVRVMVVAQSSRKYGMAEESIPVRKDLMVLPTLPRVLSPGERIELPVNVFAMTGKVKDVKVSVVEESGLLTSEVASTRAIRFEQPGDQLVRFPFQAGSETGVARFVVTASGNGESISQEIEIQVENPNVAETREDEFILEPGMTKVVSYDAFGTPSTRAIDLEVSLLPNLKIKKHINYLLRYPYGCVEQTTSSVFPQIHLAKLVTMDQQQEDRARKNIMAGIDRLQQFQLENGGLSYWPNSSNLSLWGSNYGLHFLLEAEAAGYSLPLDMKQRLLKFQTAQSNSWRALDNRKDNQRQHRQHILTQAYRLYTLALAGQANLGAMNRLRGVPELSTQATCQLAAAYKLIGKINIARELAAKASDDIENYQELRYTYGSGIRDRAMLLMALQGLGMEEKRGVMALKLAKQVNARRYLNTHESAFTLLAFANYLEDGNKNDNQLLVGYTPNGQATNKLEGEKGLLIIELPTTGSGQQQFMLQNMGKSRLYATLTNTALPLPGEEIVTSRGFELGIDYTDLAGNPIDVSKLTSGTDFIATYTVESNTTSYRDLYNIALQQIAASGWEISNERMEFLQADDPENQDRDYKTSNNYTYRDYRDDRVHTFFGMSRKGTNVYRLRMTAAYPGRFYLPTQVVETMYDPKVRATVKGQWVEVMAP